MAAFSACAVDEIHSRLEYVQQPALSAWGRGIYRPVVVVLAVGLGL